MIYKITIDNGAFKAITSGTKKVDFSFDEDKYQSIQVGDCIDFVHENNPLRSVRGIVESKISASNLASFFKVVSPTDCGLDTASVDEFVVQSGSVSFPVLGIRFSLDTNRQLEDVNISVEQLSAYLEKVIAETIDIPNESNCQACYAWNEYRKQYLKRKQPKDNLLSCVELFDDCVASYVAELAFELYERMLDAGYDNIRDYLDRPFDISDYYIVEWWKMTRIGIVKYYCGCAQQKLPAFTCSTIFDDE